MALHEVTQVQSGPGEVPEREVDQREATGRLAPDGIGHGRWELTLEREAVNAAPNVSRLRVDTSQFKSVAGPFQDGDGPANLTVPS